MGKDLRGKELGVGLYQRKDKRYSARYTNQYGKRMEFYDFKLSVVKSGLMMPVMKMNMAFLVQGRR